MNIQQDFGTIARNIIDSNIYMTLGTADENGQPWVSPVYYAAAGYWDFYWVSSPEAKHSHNILVRPQVSIVIFNSQAPINTGQAVYILAMATELMGNDLDQGIEIFSHGSEADGAGLWRREDVQPPAFHRLYRASVTEYWILDPTPGRRGDHRIQVTL